MRVSLCLLSVALCIIVSESSASDDCPPRVNFWTTLVMHTVPSDTSQCDVVEGPNDPCEEAGGANTAMDFGLNTVYLMVRGYSDVVQVQTAFAWSSLTMIDQSWDCRSSQVTSEVPDPSTSGGPIAGSLITSFDVITGGMTAAIGRMVFDYQGSGDCVIQVESARANGTHVVSSGGHVEPIHPYNRGAVCGSPGVDTCDPTFQCGPVCCVHNGPYEGVVGQPVTFDASGSNGYAYWYFGDGHYGEGEVTTHTYAAPGDYFVQLDIYRNDVCPWGYCSTTATIEEQTTSVGDDSSPELSALSLVAQPNPVAGSTHFTVNGGSGDPVTVRIYSANGRFVDVLEGVDASGASWTPPARLPAGVYHAEVELGDGRPAIVTKVMLLR